jgi:hypothetical protein
MAFMTESPVRIENKRTRIHHAYAVGTWKKRQAGGGCVGGFCATPRDGSLAKAIKRPSRRAGGAALGGAMTAPLNVIHFWAQAVVLKLSC